MSDIEWRDGAPFSRQFDDIYFHHQEGLAESKYVFCDGNDLHNRFQSIEAHQRFTIGELGFGTGLNFLVAANSFSELCPSDSHLHFISIERYPLTADDITAALLTFCELNPLRDAFIQQYRLALRHKNTFWQFDYKNIHLRVYFADAAFILEHFDIRADAWFLDGFNPKHNPDLWSESLFRKIANLAKPNCSFSTFSAAGFVRRNLESAGFSVLKRAGFGKKRECLYGNIKTSVPKNPPPWLRSPPPLPPGSTIAIIGAGLAGCLTARRLAESGYNISIFDKNPNVANATSGQSRLILYPRLTKDWSVLGSYAWLGLAHQYQLIKLYCPKAHDKNGVSLLGYNQNETKRLKKLSESSHYDLNVTRYLDAKTLSERLGITTNMGGIDIPHGGSIDVMRYLKTVINHKAIKFIPSVHISKIQQQAGWHLICDAQHTHGFFDAVVFCTAHDKPEILKSFDLPINKIRGQVSKIKASTASRKQKRVMCHKGYISPEIDGYHIVGATFNPDDHNLAQNNRHDEINLARFNDNLADIAAQFDLDTLDSGIAEVAFRATTPDHLPLVGPLADPEKTKEKLAPLSKDARKIPNEDLPWIKGLFVNIGHGSRGLIGSALSAEHIVAQITATPTPLPKAIHQHIEAQRFLRRKITRSTPRN